MSHPLGSFLQASELGQVLLLLPQTLTTQTEPQNSVHSVVFAISCVSLPPACVPVETGVLSY